MIGKCSDCKWWERRTVDSTLFGWCRYLADVKGDVGVFLFRGEWDRTTVGEKVFTASDFGCIEFEVRV